MNRMDCCNVVTATLRLLEFYLTVSVFFVTSAAALNHV